MPHAEDKPNAKSNWGKAAHAFIADALTNGKEAALTRMSKRSYHKFAAIDIDLLRAYIGKDVFHCEQAFRFDPRDLSAGFVQCADREYPDAPRSTIFGTADLIIERTGFVEIVDYKTGRSVGRVRDNWQMRSLSVMASRSYFSVPARATLLYLSDGVFLDPTEDDRCEFTYDDLAGFAAEMAKSCASDVIASGPHCQYCPARTFCLEAE